MSEEAFLRELKQQAPVLGLRFSQSGSLEIGGFETVWKTLPFEKRITSRMFCVKELMHADKPSKKVAEMYMELKRLVEQAVFEEARKHSATAVIGTPAELYGSWSFHQGDKADLFYYTCDLKLRFVNL